MSSVSIKHKALRGLGWTMLAKFTGQFFSWISTFVMVRLLAPDDYGLIGMTNVVFNMLMILSSSGMADGLVQAKRSDDRTVRSLLGFLIALNFLLFAVQFAAAPFIAEYFNEPRLDSIAKAMAFAFLLMPWIIIPQALLTREMEFKAKAGIDFVATMVTVGVSLSLAYQGYGAWSLILAQLINLLVQTIGLNLVSTVPRIPRFNFSGVTHFIGFGGAVALGSIVWGLYSNVDVVVGGRALETMELGFYVTAMQLAAMPMNKTLPLVIQVAYPAFCQMRSQRDQFVWYFRRTMRLASFLSFPIFFGLAAVAPQFVPLVLGERWTPMVMALMILSFSLPFRVAMALFSPALKALGKPWIPFFNSLITLAALIGACVYAVRWGAAGLASAWLATAVLAFLVSMFSSARAIGVRIRESLADLLPSFITSVIMFLLVWSAYRYCAMDFDCGQEMEWVGKIASLAFSILLGVVSYIVVGSTLFPRQVGEVIEVWRNRRR